MLPKHFLSVMSVSLAMTAAGHASVVAYDGNFAGWTSDVVTYTTLDFIGLPTNEILSTQFSSLGATFTGFGGWDVMLPYVPSVFLQDGFGFSGGAIVEIAFEEPMHSFAAHGPGLFRFQLFSGNQILHQTEMFGAADPNSFGGITSTRSFDRIRILEVANDPVYFDNIYFSSTIPAPPIVTMLAVMLGCSGASRRSRGRRSR
jgi:hypothetical protein